MRILEERIADNMLWAQIALLHSRAGLGPKNGPGIFGYGGPPRLLIRYAEAHDEDICAHCVVAKIKIKRSSLHGRVIMLKN